MGIAPSLRLELTVRRTMTPYRNGPLYLTTREDLGIRNFIITGMVGDTRVRRSTRTADLAEAKHQLDELLIQLRNGWRPGDGDSKELDWKQIARRMVRRHRIGAKVREIPFDLTASQVLRLMRAADFRCSISGIAFSRQPPEILARDPWAPSIDRIENRQGYVIDNIRIVCLAANLAMNEWGYDTLLRLANAVVRAAAAAPAEAIEQHRPSAAVLPGPDGLSLATHPIRGTGREPGTKVAHGL